MRCSRSDGNAASSGWRGPRPPRGWMIRLLADHGWTMSSLSGCGVRSNTRTSTSKATPTAARPGQAFPPGSAFTTARGLTRHSATAPEWRCGRLGHGFAGGQRSRHAAALGRRWRLAHMPTATTTATAFRGVKGKDGAVASNQDRCSCGPTDRVHLNAQLQPPTPGRPASAAEPTPRETVVRNAGNRPWKRTITEAGSPSWSRPRSGRRTSRAGTP